MSVDLEQPEVEEALCQLNFLWLEITKKCNLTCTHCYADSSPQEELYGNMTYTDWCSVIEQAAELGCRKLQFIGGEPTMHPRLPELIDHAKENGFEFIEVFTNATRISRSLIDCFRRNGVHVATSFYSVDPLIHEEITKGEGSWYKTVEGIKAVLQAGLSLRVGVIETENNKEEAKKALTFLKWLGVTETGIDRERHVGRGDLVQLGEDEERYEELCGQCWKGKLCVTSEGIAYPCVFSRATQVGDLRSRLKDILKSDKLFLFQQKVRTIQSQLHCNNGFFKCSPTYCSPAYCAPNVKCAPTYCAPGCHPGCDNRLIKVICILFGFVFCSTQLVKSDQVEIDTLSNRSDEVYSVEIYKRNYSPGEDPKNTDFRFLHKFTSHRELCEVIKRDNQEDRLLDIIVGDEFKVKIIKKESCTNTYCLKYAQRNSPFINGNLLNFNIHLRLKGKINETNSSILLVKDAKSFFLSNNPVYTTDPDFKYDSDHNQIIFRIVDSSYGSGAIGKETFARFLKPLADKAYVIENSNESVSIEIESPTGDKSKKKRVLSYFSAGSVFPADMSYDNRECSVVEVISGEKGVFSRSHPHLGIIPLGFKAVFFKVQWFSRSKIETPETYVLAFAGTNVSSDPAGIADVLTDAEQLFPLPSLDIFRPGYTPPMIPIPPTALIDYTQIPQYDFSLKVYDYFINLVKNNTGRTSKYPPIIFVTGHSLGGGLSAFVSGMRGVYGIGFNPATLVRASQMIGLRGVKDAGRFFTNVRSYNDFVSGAPIGKLLGDVMIVKTKSNTFLGEHSLDNLDLDNIMDYVPRK